MISKLLGIALIIYSISSFIQSFRHEDSRFALMQDGIVEDLKKTSNRLRIISAISLILGLFFLIKD